MTSRLPELFHRPGTVIELTPQEWVDILPKLKDAAMLGHLAECAARDNIDLGECPPAARRQLVAHRTGAASLHRTARWECGEIARVFAASGVPVLLLKGASYIMSDALPGRGRCPGSGESRAMEEAGLHMPDY